MEVVESRQRQPVRGVLDALFKVSARVGECAVGVEQPATGQPLAMMVPLFLVVVAAALDHLLRHPAGGGVQHVALSARHAERGQHGHMPVAALFPQQRGRVPQPGHRIVRPSQRHVRREQRPTVERRAACGLLGQFGRGAGIVVGNAVAAKRRHG